MSVGVGVGGAMWCGRVGVCGAVSHTLTHAVDVCVYAGRELSGFFLGYVVV